MKTTLGWTLSAGLALASGLTGFSPTEVVIASETSPAITIHVRNYAGVSPQTLMEAEKVATDIYRKAGVETRWADIFLMAENDLVNSVALKTFTLADIQLNIFPDVMSDLLGLSNSVMGLAPGAGPDRETVYVFDSKVKTSYWRMSSAYINGDIDRFVSMGQVLGHVIAHEVGHLLLNLQVHSPHGIMRGEWSFLDFRDMASGMLIFTPEQAEFLRADVRSRSTRQEIVNVAALVSTPLAPEADRKDWLCLRNPSASSSSRSKGIFDTCNSGHNTTYLEMVPANSVRYPHTCRILLDPTTLSECGSTSCRVPLE